MKSKKLLCNFVGIILCFISLPAFSIDINSIRDINDNLINTKISRVVKHSNNLQIPVNHFKQDEGLIKRILVNEEKFSGMNCTSVDSCSKSESASAGNIDSYIEDYSMFAVIGTGIRLPEDQIESYQGIDD